MSIGIRLHDAAGSTLAEKAASAKAQGFECTHLALSKTIAPNIMAPAAATPGLARYALKELGGLPVAVLGCYLNLAHPDEGEYKRTLAVYEGQLRLARLIGAGVVGTETGNPNPEYRYDPSASHSEDALKLFIDRLLPVVNAAQRLGALIAIEPVYTHIVCDPKRARRVLDAVHSPNLRIIYDPVNLLHPDNLSRRDALLEEAQELLADEIDIIHVKDYIVENGAIKSCAAGRGSMDYRSICRMVALRKPHVDMTLEDTTPQNAPAALSFMRRALDAAQV